MSAVTIRDCKEIDISLVAGLESSCFSSPWPEREITYEYHDNPCSKLLVAERDGSLIGYLDYMVTFDSATINRLCVKEEDRHQGVGTSLLNHMIASLKCLPDIVEFVTLEVRASNRQALALYEKNGWKKITVKPHYYENGEDAIYMVRSIL